MRERLSQGAARDVTHGRHTAMAGLVPCKVDASYGPIHVGDLLTTSPVPGRAMLAKNPKPGTVLGKALEDWAEGPGTILVLVTLQ